MALLDAPAFVARLTGPSVVGPGLGAFNLLAYRGLEASSLALGLAAWSPLLVAVIVAGLVASRRVAALPAAALAALATILLAPAVAADAVAIPIVLLAVAAHDGREAEAAQAR